MIKAIYVYLKPILAACKALREREVRVEIRLFQYSSLIEDIPNLCSTSTPAYKNRTCKHDCLNAELLRALVRNCTYESPYLSCHSPSPHPLRRVLPHITSHRKSLLSSLTIMLGSPLTSFIVQAFLIVLLLDSATTACVPHITRQDDDQTAQGEKILYLVLHILGVVFAGIASATRVSYATSIFRDKLMVISFYFAVVFFLAISLYVTYDFASPDMLLIGAAAGVIVAWRSVPRWWSISARELHWNAPMWRTRNGDIYKRVRGVIRNDTPVGDWNGPYYEATLIDGRTPIFEVTEKEPSHWEDTSPFWKACVIRGRLGDQPARRAALALRMAFSIPLPAMIKCGKSEYHASRGVLGAEVTSTWGIDTGTLTKYESMAQNGPKKSRVQCNDRTELAQLLHLKMLLCDAQKDWTCFVTDWLFGEIMTSLEPLEGALASGKVQGKVVYWNLAAQSKLSLVDT